MSDCEDDMNENSSALDGDEFVDISESEIHEAWDRLCNRHIQPSRLFAIAMELASATLEEVDHLVRCERCCRFFDRYRSVAPRDVDWCSPPSATTESKTAAVENRLVGARQESTPSPDGSLAQRARAIDPVSRTPKRKGRYVFSAMIVMALLATAVAVFGAQVVQARRTAIASIWRLSSDTERDRALLTSETARLRRQLVELDAALETLATTKQAQKVRVDEMLRTANSDAERIAKLAALLREGDASEIDEKLQLWKDFKSQDDFSEWKRRVDLASARGPNLPVGAILLSAGEVPAGWHLCDGSFVEDKTGKLAATLRGGAGKESGREELVQLPNLSPTVQGCLVSGLGSPEKDERNSVATAKMRGASVATHPKNVVVNGGCPTGYSVEHFDGCKPPGWTDAPAPAPEQKGEESNEVKAAAQPNQPVLHSHGSSESKANSGNESIASNSALRWIIRVE